MDKLNRYQLTKGSSDVINCDTPLWRYLTFKKFCWLLETSMLYHTRLDQFEDPFEGCVTNEYARRRAVEKDPIQSTINQFEPWRNKSLLYRTYAVCWHASSHESDAQWKIYGDKSAGVAVVSTMSRLNMAVDISPYRHGRLGPVEYIDLETHDMVLPPFGESIRPGFAKGKSFEHEHEVRGAILMDLIREGTTLEFNERFLVQLRSDMPLGIVAKADLNQLIGSIVIGPLAAPFVEELVHMTAKRHGFDHLVSKSKLAGKPIY